MERDQQLYLQISNVSSGYWCSRQVVNEFISDMIGISPVDHDGYPRTFTDCYSDMKDGYLWHVYLHSMTGRRFIVCSSANLEVCVTDEKSTTMLAYYDKSRTCYPFPYLYVIDEFGNDQPAAWDGISLRSLVYIDGLPEFVVHVHRLLPVNGDINNSRIIS